MFEIIVSLPCVHVQIKFYSVTFTDSANKTVTTRLIKEVQAQNPTFQASDIHCKSTLFLQAVMQHKL